MPKENHRACEMQKAREIGGAPLIPSDEAPIVLQPGKKPFDFPAAFVATQGASVLREVDSIGAMRRDELDAAVSELLVEPVAVIRGIADEPLGILGQETGV
jgi:hypothetical protein